MTDIEWTDKTWNPVTGCSKVSAGCKNCYAEAIAKRLWGERQFTDVLCHPERLDAPLRWRKPRRVFVNSMSDLFHEDVPDEFVARVFDVIRCCHVAGKGHVFQILTKRPDRMRDVMRRLRFDNAGAGHTWIAASDDASGYPLGAGHRGSNGLTNVWAGVSVEDQASADERVPLLLQTPAAVRFLSCEPLLGPVDFGYTFSAAYRGAGGRACLDWVIVGGESGPRARPCDVAWIRSIVEQCGAAKVACFVKQLGAIPVGAWKKADGKITFQSNHPAERGVALLRDRKGADPSEWPEDLSVREFPR